MFGQTLGDFQLTQAKLAQMALTIDSSALLVYRAAWLRDQGESVTREAAMAKWHASEGAQQVIDAAVQLYGGMGVQSGIGRRDAVSRDSRAAHLRRRDRSAAIDRRPRSVESACGDTSENAQMTTHLRTARAHPLLALRPGGHRVLSAISGDDQRAGRGLVQRRPATSTTRR